MPIEAFLKVIERLPDALLLISGAGTVLGTNDGLARLGVETKGLRERSLFEITAEPPEAVSAYLRRCSKTSAPLPGILTLKKSDGGELPCRSDGSILSPSSDTGQAVILLRLVSKDVSTRRFLTLNQKIDELGKEVLHRKRVEADLREQKEQLGVTLASIGDAVIATDAGGRISFINPVAESLCGVRHAEAAGRPLRDVFYIVNERTRRPVPSPVEQVLATGLTVGLANHTVLIAPDGRETPIDDSAAPILTGGGQISGVVLVFRDVTEKRRATVLNERLAAIVESSDDIIASKTLDGVITSWNRGAERILGYTAEEVVGNHVSMLIPPEHSEDMETILGRIRRGEKVDHYQTKRRRKDGTIIEVSLTVSPIRDEEGEIIGASKIGRDITAERRAREERERLLEAAQSAKAEAETANRMKDEFLATLSHELRTPLNAIIGWAKILRTGKVDAEDVEEGLSAIERNSQVQAQLIEDLLDISRIISGNLRLEVQRLSLVDVIEAAVAAVMPAAVGKNIRIHKVLDSLASPVIGDVARLQQIVWNLLSNAVKFTPKGGKVQVLLERVNSHVEVSVIDTGMGIEPEFLPHVFDRFRQADSSSTRRYGGLGLGLAIVKQLTEMHGGSIRAKSPGEGQGATFTLTMPIAVVHPEQFDKVRPRESESADDFCQRGALKGLKVLIVDDELDARQLHPPGAHRMRGGCGPRIKCGRSHAAHRDVRPACDCERRWHAGGGRL